MSPEEYGAMLADRTPRITQGVAEQAARIMLAAERESAGVAA